MRSTGPFGVLFGVLFDVGYALLDETPRLRAALSWLAAYLSARGVPAAPERLLALYRQACLAPEAGQPHRPYGEYGASDGIGRVPSGEPDVPEQEGRTPRGDN